MAFTETEIFTSYIRDRVFTCYSLVGDASDTTWSAPVGTIDAAWIQGTTGAEGILGISWATNVVTFTAAPAATSTYYVYVVGTA